MRVIRLQANYSKDMHTPTVSSFESVYVPEGQVVHMAVLEERGCTISPVAQLLTDK